MNRRGNGFGSLINKGPGKKWLARWVFKGQVFYKSTGEVDKKKALKALEHITRPFRDAREEDAIRNLQNRLIEFEQKKTKNKLLLDDLWSEFAKKLKNDDVEDSTARIYETAVKMLVTWMLEHNVKFANDINQKLAEDYLVYLATTIGAATYNIRLVLFKRIWKALYSDFALIKDVWENFKKKKVTKMSSRRMLSTTEIAKILLKAESEDMKLLLTIGMYTGLRISDCALLKWEHVDLVRKVIRTIPIKTRKHMDSPIEIPIHNCLFNMLKKLPQEGEYVSQANADGYKCGSIGGDVVELFKKCGIETSKKVNGKTKFVCSFHSLRHTFISMAIDNGMSPLLVQKIVGHSAVNMTEHYFHDNANKAAEGINMMPDIEEIKKQLEIPKAI